MKAVLADNSLTLIPIEEVQNFKPNISGRPRTTVPKWRIAYDDNTLIQTSIVVQIRKGKLEAFRKRLEEIRKESEHPFMGTIHRYIIGSKKNPNQVEISFIWRSSVMPDESTREQALEAFRQSLDDVLDWSTARYDEGTVFMHA